MLSNISWSSYWTVLLLATAIYYLYAVRLFYGTALARKFRGNSLPGKEMPIDEPEDKFLQHYRDEINAYLEQASYERPEKRELLVRLRHIGQHHPVILQHPYCHAAQQILMTELKNYCAVTLNGDELEQVMLVK